MTSLSQKTPTKLRQMCIKIPTLQRQIQHNTKTPQDHNNTHETKTSPVDRHRSVITEKDVSKLTQGEVKSQSRHETTR